MKKIVILLLLLTYVFGYSQEDSTFKISDSTSTDHSYTFDRSPNDEILNTAFKDGEDSSAPTFKKKCSKLSLNSKREKCFKEKFYTILAKKFEIPSGYPEETTIVIVTRFRINKKGEIERVEFLMSNDDLGKVEEEIERILYSLPEIEPAVVGGKKVTVPYSFPIRMKVH